ncbi:MULTISPECIES: alpha/beta hydrolase [unclassified Microbacterium]|uniref:alpha/beta hydrolase n=1 Tax=unclassified Microbacterium TaxID=2609290 RepID=UPI000EA8B0FC|nr:MULTISPECIES: alpha/beta hydrolase [unclassified Microbacterium]MBT2486175.1 alpha/beta fold hydrolase [Microbacterium sp. ISL-108]RKN68901.1 alpha/beta hydrolase [Microbacterium sp. CGR2]
MDDVGHRKSGLVPRRWLPVVAALGAVVVGVPLAACSPTPVETVPSGSPEADLRPFYEQQLDWGECGPDHAQTNADEELFALVPGVECARMEIPLDYDEPSGDRGSVAILRVPARGESLGPLVINPGGPGGSGVTGAIIAAAGLVESPITESFDVVGFDPRGVGSTIPAIDCYSDEEADAGTVPLGAQGTTVSFTEEDTRAIVDKCAELSGGEEILTQVGTRDTARDLDVLRAVLGEEKLTYFGQSYGTRLGAVYAEMFPDNVRALLLDGGKDPLEGAFDGKVNAYAGFQRAFDQMAAFCAQQEDCPLGTDPAEATARFQEIMQPLRTRPVPALKTELTFDDAVGGTIAGLYNPAAWPAVIAGIREVAQGRGDTLMQLIYSFSARTESGQWPNSTEANYAINCMDEDRLSPEQVAELRTATYEQAPFMDPGADVTAGARDSCEHWPAEPTLGTPYAQNVVGLPDTLVVSITGDPTTPHAGGISLAESLGSALLTVEGEGHTIVAQGTNACVDEIASAYLIDLEVPEEGATCVQ